MHLPYTELKYATKKDK